MPTVGKKRYPYTKAGKQAAQAARKRVVPKKKKKK